MALFLAALAALCAAATANAGSPLPSGLLFGGDPLITFDDLNTGGPVGGGAHVTVNTQYAPQGVTFNNVTAIDYSKGQFALPGFAHSGNVAVEQCVGSEFCTTPVTASFTAPQRTARVWVGFSGQLSQPVQVQLNTAQSDLSATTQLLHQATAIEEPHVLTPASAARITARSRRNSVVVGGLIGLVLGALAALLWDRVAEMLARRRS